MEKVFLVVHVMFLIIEQIKAVLIVTDDSSYTEHLEAVLIVTDDSSYTEHLEAGLIVTDDSSNRAPRGCFDCH